MKRLLIGLVVVASLVGGGVAVHNKPAAHKADQTPSVQTNVIRRENMPDEPEQPPITPESGIPTSKKASTPPPETPGEETPPVEQPKQDEPEEAEVHETPKVTDPGLSL